MAGRMGNRRVAKQNLAGVLLLIAINNLLIIKGSGTWQIKTPSIFLKEF